MEASLTLVSSHVSARQDVEKQFSVGTGACPIGRVQTLYESTSSGFFFLRANTMSAESRKHYLCSRNISRVTKGGINDSLR